MPRVAVSLTQTAIPVFKAVMGRKQTIPILGYVLVIDRNGEPFGIATDLDRYVIMPVDAGTPPGLYTIIGKELVLANECEAKDFPVMPTWNNEAVLPIPVDVLKSALPFVSREESRYTLNGILVRVPSDRQDITVSATDGHKLRLQRVANPGGLLAGDYILPRATIEVATRFTKDMLYLKFNASEESSHCAVRIVTPTFGMYSRIVSGKFPNYEALMPREFKRQAVVSKADLEAAMATVKPFSDERSGCVSWRFEDGVLTLFASVNGYSKTVSLPCTLDGAWDFPAEQYLSDPSRSFALLMPMRGAEPLLGLSIHYTQEIVKGMPGERVWIGWKDAQSTVTFLSHPYAAGAYQVRTEAVEAVA